MPRKGLRPRQPRKVEARYTRDLRRVSAQISREIEKATKQIKFDADLDLPSFFVDMQVAEDRVIRITRSRTVMRLIDQQARRVMRWNLDDMERVLRIKLTMETPRVQALLESFRSENVDLITRMGQDQLNQMRELVAQSTQSGMRVETLQKKIQERFAVGKSRAELIARDQTLKANGALTMIRQRDAGITEYEWSTSLDERVRESHADLHGQRFAWDQPPDVGHPGEDFQCRCTATPIIPGL